MSLRSNTLLLLLALGRPATGLVAQVDVPTAPNPVLVEALAPILMAEDQRRFDSTLFAHALLSPEAQVRSHALLSLGRIGNHRATALMLPLLLDRDPHVVADGFFALGLMGDTAAIDPIIARLERLDTLTVDGIGEAASALARIGGHQAGVALGQLLRGNSRIPSKRRAPFNATGLLDAWRLGPDAPITEILAFTNDPGADLRYASVFSLARLVKEGYGLPNAAAIGQALLFAVRDKHPLVQEVAVRALTKAFADSAHLPATAVTTELIRAFTDPKTGIRINAMAAAATWHDPALSAKVAPFLVDPVVSVQIQAALTLADLGGPAATKALDNALSRKESSWALRRTALVGLASVDHDLFSKRATSWLRGIGTPGHAADWREQVAALEGYGKVAPADPGVFVQALADPKPEVIAAALIAWQTARPKGDPALVAAAKLRLRHPNEEVRAAAVNALIGQVTAADLDAVLGAWQTGTAAKSMDDRMAVLALVDSMVHQNSAEVIAALSDPSRQFFFVRPADAMGMVLRGEAERRWPLLAQRWGPSVPLDVNETGRSLDDYRGIVRTYLLAEDNPHAAMDLGGGNVVDLELLGHDAPLTVANFVRLVKTGYFDQNRWHRVVPNFVIQSGDPTGTGDGGPGWTIRAEINRWRYDNTMVGMADAGLDSGGSQWFINLSAQPHLDGRYTIFAKVGASALNRVFSKISEGDQIRSIKIVAADN